MAAPSSLEDEDIIALEINSNLGIDVVETTWNEVQLKQCKVVWRGLRRRSHVVIGRHTLATGWTNHNPLLTKLKPRDSLFSKLHQLVIVY